MSLKLRIIHGRPTGRTLLFPLGDFLIGRGAECHVRPNSEWVSRQHCLLRVTRQGIFLRDLGSRNGTLVNGTRLVDERLLSQGDRVQIGPLVFEVLLEEASSRSMVVGTQVPDDTYVSPENMTQTVRTTDFPSLDAPISAPEVKVNEPPPSSEKSSEQPAHGPREKGAGARP